MAVSREAVTWAFRLVLGREIDSEEGIAAHMRLADVDALMATLLQSPEFRQSPRLKSVVSVQEAASKRAPTYPWPYQSRAALRVAILGNCQAGGLARAMQAMTGDLRATTIETTPSMMRRMLDGDFDLKDLLERHDLILLQRVGEITRLVRQRFPRHAGKLRQVPPLTYSGFHPDCVYVRGPQGMLQGPTGEYHSSIVFWGWQQGLSIEQTLQLFSPEVFDALGLHEYHDSSRRLLVSTGQQCELPLDSLLERWRDQGCWMHSVNHPKIGPIVDLAAEVLRREGINPIPVDPAWIDDTLALWPVWPVYPGVAERMGLQGHYAFKLDGGFAPAEQPVLTMDLPAFVEAWFKRYALFNLPDLHCERTETAAYGVLHQFVPRKRSRLQGLTADVTARVLSRRPLAKGNSPYAALPDGQFWRRAVERLDCSAVDPVGTAAFRIRPEDKVATAGSCFAQHISRTLQAQGFNFHIAETPPADLAPEVARAQGYGVYSARYGNLYTARQLVQLFDRAHGDFQPLDRTWMTESGRYVDPFRPQVPPEGYASAAEVHAAARQHLAAVRRLFVELDVFVFTLGLTEAWRRRQDGAVFPLAPGVVAGNPDPQRYEFVNFAVHEVAADLRGFISRLRRVNPKARLIFTVSPVPLIATYEDRHVLVSTTYSKAVLRAAAGEVCAPAAGVDYFPSYEVITGAHARGAYFEADLRNVTASGVAHVMRLFLAHYTGDTAVVVADGASRPNEVVLQAQERELRALNDLVCDEEAIDRHRR